MIPLCYFTTIYYFHNLMILSSIINQIVIVSIELCFVLLVLDNYFFSESIGDFQRFDNRKLPLQTEFHPVGKLAKLRLDYAELKMHSILSSMYEMSKR